MIVTTSNFIEGKQIKEYLGIVSAAKLGRLKVTVKGIENFWSAGVDSVIEVLAEKAVALGADAIISVSFQSSVDGNEIRATGTAVKFEQ